MDIAKHEKEHEVLGLTRAKVVFKKEIPELCTLDKVLGYGNKSTKDMTIRNLTAQGVYASSSKFDALVAVTGEMDTAVLVSLSTDTMSAKHTSIDEAIINEHFRFPVSPPPSPVQGSAYYDPATDTLYIYDGTAWRPH